MRRVLVAVLFFTSILASGTPGHASELTFTPAADAYLSAYRPNSNYGGSSAIQADADPVERSLVRFEVSGVGSGSVTGAKLRLYNANDSTAGGDFSLLASEPAWAESSVTYNTAPAAAGSPFASLGAVSQGRWYEVDLSSIVTGDGTFEFGLSSTSGNGVGYASREAAADKRPQLVVTVGSASAPPPPTPPTVTITSPAAGSTVSGTRTVQAAASDDNAVSSVQFLVDGTPASTDAAAPFTFEWNTATLPNGAHLLGARAFDADGLSATSPSVSVNVSNATASPSPSPAPPPEAPSSSEPPSTSGLTLTFSPVADTYIRKDKPTTNFGTLTSVYADNASPIAQSLLRFAVSGVRGGTVTGAKLRLYNTNDSAVGGTFWRLAATPSWTENAVTWNTAPLPTGIALASVGAVVKTRWYEVDLRSMITGDGTFDVGITSTSSDGVMYASKEATPAIRPQLVVTYLPDPAAPTVEITAPTAGQNVSGTFVVKATATDDRGVVAVDFSVDGVRKATDTTAPYTFSWSTTSVVDGYHELSARVVDADGKQGWSKTVQVGVYNAVAGPPPSGTVTFGAAGDWGANSTTAASLNKLNSSGVNFFLLVGDLDYGEVRSPADWCTYVRSRLPLLGPDFPIELIAGNHEEETISQHAACMPDRLGAVPKVGSPFPTEYYFDYPASAPMIRSIMISPGLIINNVAYNYSAGSTRYNWVASAIDGARARGIPWVTIGMHKNCFSAESGSNCEVGEELMTLLARKKVDLIIQGHKHTYKRGKQLAINGTTCTGISVVYNTACVVDDGADGVYRKGAGPIVMISGSFGKGGSSSSGGYFAKAASSGNGFTKFTVTPTKLSAEFVNSTSSFRDSYSITS